MKLKLSILASATLFSACSTPSPMLANPASVFCKQTGGTVVIKEEAAGQVGICTFPDGSAIEEWKLYREHHPDAAT